MQEVLTEQLPSIEGPEDLTSQSQVDKLINRMDKFLQKLESHESQTMGKPRTESGESSKHRFIDSLKSAWAVILIVLGAVGTGWKLHSEFSSIKAQIGSLKMAVKILADSQGGRTKELVDDALAISKANLDAGNSKEAQSALSIANAVMAELKSSKVPADPQFFSESVNKFRSLRSALKVETVLTDEAFRGILELAEYRSALTAAPTDFHPRYEYKGPEGVYIGNMNFANGREVISDSAFYGPQSAARGTEGGFLLDGLELQNVVFIGVTLRYHGGFLVMKNVWFVNCTFQVNQSVRGSQFLEVASLGQKSANLG